MAHSTAAELPSSPDRQQNLRDAMVVGSITLCALALGLGLYLQFGLTFWLAIVTALSAYVALLFAHVAMRRSGEVARLRDEVEHLRGRTSGGPLARDAAAFAESAKEFGVPPDAVPAGPAALSQMASGGAEAASAAEPQLPPWPEPAEAPYEQPSPDTFRRPARIVARQETSIQAMPQQVTLVAERGDLAAGSAKSAVEFDRLQELIKELATSVGGPKAATSDPDLWPSLPGTHAAYAREEMTDRAVSALSNVAGGAGSPALHATAGSLRVDRHAEPSLQRLDVAHARSDPRQSRLVEALEAERVEVYLEPIQGLGDRKPHHFEVSVRFRDALGSEMNANEVAEIARAGGLLPKLDAVKLPRVLRVARRVRSRGRPADVLASIAGESLGDNGFIDRFAAELMSNDRIRVVFTFSEADVRAFGRVHWQTLEAMADIGIRFALDQVYTLDLDLDRLKSVGFEFIKLDASVFLNGLPSPGGVIPAVDICRHLSSQGLTLIVSRIEDEWALARVMGFGALFGQGTLFGAPRPVRADVLSDAASAA